MYVWGGSRRHCANLDTIDGCNMLMLRSALGEGLGSKVGRRQAGEAEAEAEAVESTVHGGHGVAV